MKHLENIKSLEDLNILKDTKPIKNHQYQCRCPFHKDKNPSFGINLKTGFYNCFACGASGKSFDSFFQKIGNKYNIWFETNKKDNNVINNKNSELQILEIEEQKSFLPLQEMNDAILSYYKDPHSNYMLDRVPDKYVRDLFEIGYSKKEDKYIIPIRDENKILVGYVFRQFVQPKYKYGSFEKSKVLFGLDKVVGDQCILTEGPLDVIKTYNNGFKNCIAILGGHLSEHQEKLILKHFNTLIIAVDFDTSENDYKGQRLANEIYDKLKDKIKVYRFSWTTATPETKKDLGDMTPEELHKEFKNLL